MLLAALCPATRASSPSSPITSLIESPASSCLPFLVSFLGRVGGSLSLEAAAVGCGARLSCLGAFGVTEKQGKQQMLDDFAFFFVIPFALLLDASLAARGVAGCVSAVLALPA